MSIVVTGYSPLSEDAINQINIYKRLEQECLSHLRLMLTMPLDFNPRWTALARTHIQTGFMMMIRATAIPEGDE